MRHLAQQDDHTKLSGRLFFGGQILSKAIRASLTRHHVLAKSLIMEASFQTYARLQIKLWLCFCLDTASCDYAFLTSELLVGVCHGVPFSQELSIGAGSSPERRPT